MRSTRKSSAGIATVPDAPIAINRAGCLPESPPVSARGAAAAAASIADIPDGQTSKENMSSDPHLFLRARSIRGIKAAGRGEAAAGVVAGVVGTVVSTVVNGIRSALISVVPFSFTTATPDQGS